MAFGEARPTALIGRDAECALLRQLVADVRAGASRVLVIRGEAGTGKTSLLGFVESISAGSAIVRTAGVESEMELPFAGLHQLCLSMLGRLDGLPDPQRVALGTAFGLVAGAPPDRFLVGLAVLGLLADTAEEQPLICLVDDAQWLDRVSAQVLAFVARRLQAESVALLVGRREPSSPSPLDGLPDCVVDGLADADARALLDAVVPWRLDERVRARLVAETRGNPLALVELTRGRSAAEMAGGFVLPDALPVARHIEQSFARRVEALPRDTRWLLGAASADPSGDVALLRRATARLGIDVGAEVPAERAGLIELRGRVLFRHPLVRSAAYRHLGPEERRRIHHALADSTDAVADPDRRAWHRAHAADRPDDAIARDLEASARRAQARGGFAAAAAFLERATELSLELEQRSRRALAAAHAKFEAGSLDEVEALLVEAELGSLDDLQAALVVRLRAQIEFARRRGNVSPALLLAAARQLEPLDTATARETYLDALGAAIFAGRLGVDAPLSVIASAARAVLPTPADQPVDVLLAALVARYADRVEASIELARRAVASFSEHRDVTDADVHWLWVVCLLALELGDDAAWEALATRAVRVAREAGALSVLPVALHYRAVVHIFAGELAAAATLIDEADAIAAATGNARPWLAAQVLVAWQGDEAVARGRLMDGIADAVVRGEGRALNQSAYLLAVLCNGLGRYDEARVAAAEACEHDDIAVRGLAAVELVEAAARSGHPDVALAGLRVFEERAREATSEWARGTLARSRALVAQGADADALYREAIERLGRTRMVVHLARAQLVYGEWLRREDRRRDARPLLRAAYECLDDIGVGAYAERARRELRATGEAARPRTVAAGHDLTPQETQIAELAAGGRTNPEIGRELFISARTVEYHIAHIFTKLGISSRRELGSRLASGRAGSPSSARPAPLR